MCGIFFYIYPIGHHPDFNEKELNDLKELIANRGPDVTNSLEFEIKSKWKIQIFCSTLWTQGSAPTKQPLQSENGRIFLWNGDVFSGLDLKCDISDTDQVFALIQTEGVNRLSKICGPYSFIYHDPETNEIWISRDVIGRNSLLWKLNSNSAMITSVSTKSFDVEEVPSYGLFKLEILEDSFELVLHPWSHLNPSTYDNVESFRIGCKIAQPLDHEILEKCKKYSWINQQPSVINLKYLNVFKDNLSPSDIFKKLLNDEVLTYFLKDIQNKICEAVQKRIVTQPNYCKICSAQKKECSHCKTAICFSGGLDSTVIALIANKYVPPEEPIDLFNIAFERPSSNDQGFQVPDRISGMKSYEELQNLAPTRNWNFIEIDVSQEELNEERKQRINHLIHPLDSILDDSLGCALWFAVRGKGNLNGASYTSNARIVLLGMGADELFGGYSRHRKEFAKSGWTSLGEQLISEARNIGKRNLGRDNRVAADHGRQPRFPFLDEHVYATVDSLPPWFRCYPGGNHQPGIGDKFLLRLIAWNLGLRNAALLPKKALQFGSRIANPKEKGHLTSARLK